MAVANVEVAQQFIADEQDFKCTRAPWLVSVELTGRQPAGAASTCDGDPSTAAPGGSSAHPLTHKQQAQLQALLAQLKEPAVTAFKVNSVKVPGYPNGIHNVTLELPALVRLLPDSVSAF